MNNDLTDEQRARALGLYNTWTGYYGLGRLHSRTEENARAWLAVEAHVLASHTRPDAESDPRVQAWLTVAKHPFFADCYSVDDTLLNAVLAKLDTTDELAHMTEARDNARAEVERLAGLLAEVREWIDRRGVNVDDRDDDYMRGYRDAQRHALQDAAELRATLDAEDPK